METALVLLDLLDAGFGEQGPSSKIRQLGRQIPDERIELGEGALFRWCVV